MLVILRLAPKHLLYTLVRALTLAAFVALDR